MNKQAPLCDYCGRPMKHGDVTNLCTQEKTERFFCILHPKYNVLVDQVPEGDPEADRRCPSCATLLVWNGYKFQCPIEGCHINERWGDR